MRALTGRIHTCMAAAARWHVNHRGTFPVHILCVLFVCAHVYMEARGQHAESSSTARTLLPGQGLCSTWGLHMQVDCWLAGRPQKSYLCPSQHWGSRHAPSHLTFYMGSRDSDSGPSVLACQALYPLNHPTTLICIPLKEITIYSYLAFRLSIELNELFS